MARSTKRETIVSNKGLPWSFVMFFCFIAYVLRVNKRTELLDCYDFSETEIGCQQLTVSNIKILADAKS